MEKFYRDLGFSAKSLPRQGLVGKGWQDTVSCPHVPLLPVVTGGWMEFVVDLWRIYGTMNDVDYTNEILQ